MKLKMIFYLSNVAIAVNMSQPGACIGGDLHTVIHIFFIIGGIKAPNRFGTLKTRSGKTRIAVTLEEEEAAKPMM